MIAIPKDSRVLDPIERFAEIVFGLIMVLSFTCALSVAEAGREEVREMFIGAISCNLAWGLIDAVNYLIACVAQNARNAALLATVQSSENSRISHDAILATLPRKIAETLLPDELEKIAGRLRAMPVPKRPRLGRTDMLGALGVFLLVFLSTFPVVIPFIVIQEAGVALRISNAIAILSLFAAGWMLARYAGMRPVVTGLAMIVIGVALVSLTIALGG